MRGLYATRLHPSNSPNMPMLLTSLPGHCISGLAASAVLGLLCSATPVAAICNLVQRVPNTQSHQVCSSGPGWCELFLESHSEE